MKMQKFVIFVEKKIENRYLKEEKYRKVRGHCHYTGNIEVVFIAYVL